MLDRPTGTGTASLLEAAPPISLAAAEDLAAHHYGLSVRAYPLAGERDDNFALTTIDGRRLVLKVVHPAEVAAVTTAQTEVLDHVARTDPGLPIARLVPATDGALAPRATGGTAAGRALRMTTFCAGTPLREATPSAALREVLGMTLARVARALRSFGPAPGSHPRLLWDLARASELRSMVGEIDRPERRRQLEAFLDRYDRELAPRLAHQRRQWVHNDFNGDNILVEGTRVSGVLDFGDMAETQLVNDVAIAATHIAGTGARPLAAVADLVRGYESVTALTEEELRMLPDLMMTRMVARLAISEWRAARFPENRDYILRDVARTWGQLTDMQEHSPDALGDELLALRAEGAAP
ncbi:phosphotransferase [Pseudonocardia sp. MH-G8]|uniref:phosphotransferase n=1 Tax=Pseudonocardia sp. MH-G8 TaxID=1854588 RepID=UPI000BA18221|nr:phosphotransferase [Pseudonocardia sp. MH-G8]OZM77499.1 aminoglycoside phosphotransferase [Pseudonocardia sp. MH-G8]